MLKYCGHGIDEMNSFWVLKCHLRSFLLGCRANNLLWWKHLGVWSPQVVQTSWVSEKKISKHQFVMIGTFNEFHLKWSKSPPSIHSNHQLSAGRHAKTNNHSNNPFLWPAGDSQCTHKGKRRSCKLHRKQPVPPAVRTYVLQREHIM